MSTKKRPSGGTVPQPTGPARPSFEEVYHRHVSDVWWMLRTLGVAEADCDDATQEVFLVVHRRLPEYEPRDRLKGWLGAIAANIAAKFRHREARMATTDADPDGQEGDAFELEEELASAEDVRRVLEEVDPELRFVFIQHHFHEVPLAEIAKQLEVSEGTVKTRLHLARKAVRAAWTRYKAKERRTDGSNVVLLPWLEAARQAPRLPDEVRARIWAGIERARRMGGDGGGEGREPPAVPEPSMLRPMVAALRGVRGRVRALVAMVAAGLFGVGLTVGVVLGVLWAPLHRQESAFPAVGPSSPEVAVMAAKAALASPVPPALAPNAPQDEVHGEAPSEAAPPSTTGVATADAAALLAIEKALLERAEAALSAGNPNAALQIAREHAATFHGGGRLAQHRETLRIAALIRAGRTSEARERLARFAAAYPNSPRLPELREALPSSP